MASIVINSKSHKTALLNLQVYSRPNPISFKLTECPTRNQSRYSTSRKQANSLAGRRSNLIGRLYEKHSMKCMREILLFKDLVHVGKKASHDGGIDIRGWLYLNRSSEIKSQLVNSQANKGKQCSQEAKEEKQERFVKAIAQCKYSRTELSLVREFEGLVASNSTHRNASSSKPIIGIIFSSRGFTTPSLTQAGRSPFPLILVTLDFPPALRTISQNAHSGDHNLSDDDVDLHPPCRISQCYPNPIAVQLIHPFELTRVSKLTTDGSPAQHSWILVNRQLEAT